MARKVFFSFHYKPDAWRASQVRNMGIVEGDQPCSDNDWESITQGGDAKIEQWITQQMVGRTCVVVLIGSDTANRKWINREIVKGWDDKKGVVGIYIHNLSDSDNKQVGKGANPFDYIQYGNTGRKLSSVVKAYEPPYTSSKYVYDDISTNLAGWVDEAISIRSKY